MFFGAYREKRVLVTGHTGFKGSWLTLWLLELGAQVAGFSLYLPSDPCNFEILNLKEKISHYEGDIRDINALKDVFEKFQPEIVFHLAAQPIVRKAYDDPKLTFDTNLGGTVNILECIKNSNSVEAAVMITSDKCYDNVSWEWGYRENDRLGGDDSYSASKACAEIACRAYISSFFRGDNAPKIVTTRAGNVIGGGDWAEDRIVPDCMRAWSKGEDTVIRNFQATRPWQYILEPLSGYLHLGAEISRDARGITGEAFNFGPGSDIIKSVGELVDMLSRFWDKVSWKTDPKAQDKKEAKLLKLNCDKALFHLGWRAVLGFEETCKLTTEWYKSYYQNEDCYSVSRDQICNYIKKAERRGIPWAVGKGAV
ncbi:MAG: CDP-glucose 4,6-dehydratase [Candidatus Omnitrophica bacterium]|nr:CDP-glucose 4,6-dehydratase [Candidatus Omnitrophota bacterium]